MLKFAAFNFAAAMLPGNVLAPFNLLAGMFCVFTAGVDAVIEFKK